MGDDDFGAVIHPSFGRFPEGQLVALDLAEKDVRVRLTETFHAQDVRVRVSFLP